jgi:DNA integrity scanning protein DisA with diadenylate cyclase activity
MRHRAALGLGEVSDASIIVVSEETGNISFVKEGNIRTMGSITELRLAIEESYK